MKAKTEVPQYGNWISTKLIRRMFVLFLIFGIADTFIWMFLYGWLPLKIMLSLIAVFFLLCMVYFYYSKRLFSADGGDIQNKVLDLLVSRIDRNEKGKTLDVGCGSGALTIKLAQKYAQVVITGVDYWGGPWGYQQKQCEENASIENVNDRTKFLQASASKLPFSDNEFDLVISNLTFHEVRDSRDKLEVLKESIRVLKKGGRFVFQDLFLLKNYFGTPDELLESVNAMGVTEVNFHDTSKSSFIPKALRLPFMLGTLGIIEGIK